MDDGAVEIREEQRDRREEKRRLIVRFVAAVALDLFTGVYKRAAGFDGSDPNSGTETTENEHSAFFWAAIFNKSPRRLRYEASGWFHQRNDLALSHGVSSLVVRRGVSQNHPLLFLCMERCRFSEIISLSSLLFFFLRFFGLGLSMVC
ncbi:uncharacterized protein LOC9329260 isoform X1 [Arabidopsis lyrata subsp. lyrata]|uniref:uncharacterized protein LOC9329260 isoform X1 n=1 Tax=Arabidopsis lyrata subsp. lyrata TaxID=81972 RepID=UPI000A29D2E5|nr:uncharacterized protein LOC9329260 isoform X1 [Arabidopsis lyrata subsp. lyrata]|eukprot:XP_020867048.1 uncharacterized protein LOC9329260 isoform X1 [Arabidopsis lyrata subsp. lyrata]